MSAEQELEKLAKQIIVCTKCELQHSRKKAVPGEGPTRAEIMLIGEGPGARENEQGRPFVGAAGKFLDELLEKARQDLEQVQGQNEAAASTLDSRELLETLSRLAVPRFADWCCCRCVPSAGRATGC